MSDNISQPPSSHAPAIEAQTDAPKGHWIHPAQRWTHVLELIEANLDSPLRVHDLARAANLSPFHFAREFRKRLGTSPHAYVTAHRVERAGRLLLESSMPIREIAVRVGFSTQAHFSGVFKQRTGATPGEFRRHRGQRASLNFHQPATPAEAAEPCAPQSGC
jgi:AraC family transcriptional regulator